MLLAPHFCPTCCSQQPPLINRSEREKKKVFPGLRAGGESLFPLVKGASVKTPWRFGSSSASEGSLSFGKCAAALGLGLLGKRSRKHLLVGLSARLCGELWAAGGQRGWGQRCSGAVWGQAEGARACSPPRGPRCVPRLSNRVSHSSSLPFPSPISAVPCLRNRCPSSTRRAGRRRRSCPRPCRPPRLGGGRCPPTCSGAEAPCWGWMSPSPEKGTELLTYAFILIKFSPPSSQPRVISRLAASRGASWSRGSSPFSPNGGRSCSPTACGAPPGWGRKL